MRPEQVTGKKPVHAFPVLVPGVYDMVKPVWAMEINRFTKANYDIGIGRFGEVLKGGYIPPRIVDSRHKSRAYCVEH